MAIEFVDRVPTYANRMKITPESGSAYYATVERADSPIENGTPLNAETFNAVVEEISTAVSLANAGIKSLSVEGKVITYTRNDGTTGTITTQDTAYTLPTATTSQLGGVKLSNAVNSTSNSGFAATPAAVKAAYDKVSMSMDSAGTTLTITYTTV